MSLQAYFDSIHAKTGNTPEDFKRLASERGLTTFRELVAWLKSDFGLGHGHATAMAHSILGNFDTTDEERLAKQFTGAKASWRAPVEELIGKVTAFGRDAGTAPTDTYGSFVRGGKKFTLVQVTAKRVDIGVKLKDVPPDGRLEASGSWNPLVTHRVRVTDPAQLDGELLGWLRCAYDAT
jgi:hypothetical protein